MNERAPELLAEAKAFVKLIEEMTDQPKTDRDLLRFTIAVPREQAVMAAWVMLKETMEAHVGVPTVLDQPVMLELEDGRKSYHWQLAKEYFQRTIFKEFDADFTQLLLGIHPLLSPKPQPSRFVGPSEGEADDIPF